MSLAVTECSLTVHAAIDRYLVTALGMKVVWGKELATLECGTNGPEMYFVNMNLWYPKLYLEGEPLAEVSRP